MQPNLCSMAPCPIVHQLVITCFKQSSGLCTFLFQFYSKIAVLELKHFSSMKRGFKHYFSLLFRKRDKDSASLQPSTTCQWFQLLTIYCQRFTHQPIIFCAVRPTHISFALAVWAVSLFSSQVGTLVSHVCFTGGTPLPFTLKKTIDCSQSNKNQIQ